MSEDTASVSQALQGSAPDTSLCLATQLRDFILLNAITPTPMRQLLRITATFTLTLVFTAGMAFGQGAITNGQISQANNNNVSVVQVTGGPSASATIEQAGKNNASALRQGNAPGIVKFPGLGGISHSATIQMLGNGNFSNVFQQANDQGHSDVLVQMQGNNNRFASPPGQAGNSDVQVAGNSDVDVSILGNQNTVESGIIENSNVTVEVEGSSNDILAESQAFVPGPNNLSNSTIRVSGSDNDVNVQQGTFWQSFKQGNSINDFSVVELNGSGNSVTVKQGIENFATQGPRAGLTDLDLQSGFVNFNL